jgi:hypothetical protein
VGRKLAESASLATLDLPSLQKVNVMQLLSAQSSIPDFSCLCVHNVVKNAALLLLLALFITKHKEQSSQVIS